MKKKLKSLKKNSKKNHNLKLKISFFLILSFLFLIFPSPTEAVNNPQSYEITVSATLGEPKLTLFGYSSPHSLVQLRGERVAEEVIADNQGYFLFDRAFLPYPNPQYPELCLNAIDTQSRISFPVCLPTLPTGPFNFNIGPVLLAPTFSLEKDSAEGLTIPNTEVNIFLANDASQTKSNFLSRLFRFEVSAYSLPQYKIKSDSQGRFEFSLPTIKPNNWRLFTAAEFQGSPTPKSNTLNFKILNWWQWLLLMITNLLRAFLRLVKPFWWSLLICLELGLIVFLLAKIKLHSLG